MSYIQKAISRKEQKEKTNDICYVTELTKCLLKAYLDRKNPQEYDDPTLRRFAAGDLIEEAFLQTLYKDPDIYVIDTQYPAYYINETYEIHGRIDILTQHQKQKIVAHEVKSAKDYPWKEEPYENHQKQLQFYLGATGITNGEINYISKKALVTGEKELDQTHIVIMDITIYEEMIQRGKILTDALKTATPPQPEPSWLCDYCQHECPTRKKENGEDNQ